MSSNAREGLVGIHKFLRLVVVKARGADGHNLNVRQGVWGDCGYN